MAITNTNNGAAPSRTGSANKSPKSTGDWSSKTKATFPRDYGNPANGRAGSLVWVPGPATLYAEAQKKKKLLSYV
tara:strand:+ start:522 stop:746 length:225 start_codon:yes stop_codon:yes gene_type:complete